MKSKNKLHTWYVSTGFCNKQLPVKTDGMEEARQKAYQKFIGMTYEEFQEYIPLNVSGIEACYE